jgi:hypothetical protein
MASQYITQLVDDLISKGRIQSSMRDNYLNMLTASPELEQELSSMLLRGGDYTKKTQELANERRQAEQWFNEEKQRLQAERQKLDSWYNNVQGELTEYEKVKREVLPIMAAYRQKLEDYQILDEVTPPVKSTVPTNPTYTPPKQTQGSTPVNNFITRDDFEKVVNNYNALNSKVDKIKSQHFKLFGEWLDEDLAGHYFQTGQDPEEYWRTKFAVETKRQEIEAKNREAETAKIREEERAKIMAEIATDPNRIVNPALGGRPVGGLTPHLEQFSHSRATAHSQNHANDNAAVGGSEFIPPEKRAPIVSTRERTQAAVDKFSSNFDITGQPTTEEGRRMFREHFVTN